MYNVLSPVAVARSEVNKGNRTAFCMKERDLSLLLRALKQRVLKFMAAFPRG